MRMIRPACALLLLGPYLACGSSEPQAASPPPTVVVADVLRRDTPVYAEWVGSTEGSVNARIRAQVKGYLIERKYREGHFVRAGDPLFQIDPRQFEAQLAIARGTLGEAEAKLGKSELDVKRYTPLAQAGAVSREELDDAIQEKLANQAAVAKARSEVARALLDVEWTKITSPIDGIAGIAEAQIGDLVDLSTPLTTVSQLDPIKVEFPISEQEYLALTRSGPFGGGEHPGRFHDALELTLADGRVYAHRGTPSVIGRAVDPTTGTIVVEGLFPNPDNLLRPGQFATVRARVETLHDALLVPQRAIREAQGSHEVSVVDSDDVAQIRSVEVGPRSGELWVVSKGLAAGERVVVEGLQKVRSGIRVRVKAPSPKAAAATSAESQ